jgi:tRNA pseudouridine55 synthase
MRHLSDLTGILVLDKDLGMSSMRAVEIARRRAGRAKAGHAGTLDPLATGVLVVAFGRATKAIDLLMATEKGYETDVDLSAFTTTDDREGERREVAAAAPPAREAVERALAGFTGEIMQKPPAFSAIHVGGKRAYALARNDAPPDLPPRKVMVHEIALVKYEWPIATVAIRSGKGFYVRSPSVSSRSLMPMGRPCSGPNSSPRITAASASFAAAWARSSSKATTAFTAWFTSPMRFRQLSSNSTGESLRRPIRRRASTAVRSQGSVIGLSSDFS